MTITCGDPVPKFQLAEHVRFWMGHVNAGAARQVEETPPHNVRLHVVGGAADAAHFVEELRQAADYGHVWGINSGYDFLIHNQILPRAMMVLDPLPAMLRYLDDIQPGTVFYISSTAHPALWERVKDREVYVFHSMSGASHPNGYGIDKFIMGGTSTMTRAPHLGHMLGYRHCELYGVASSFAPGGPTHANGEDLRFRIPEIRVLCNGAVFATQADLLAQAVYLRDMLKAEQGDMVCGVQTVGNTLIAAMLSGDGTYELIPETEVEAA